MSRKRILLSIAVLAALCLLIYFQVRTWKQFDWHTFWLQTEHVNKLGIIAGLVFTYLAYYLRAVRWKIFLKPVCKTTTRRLLAPQFVGFTALALLGRAGEVIRPYIVAKKENLTFASQMAVWTVERIFDMGAFALMLALSLFSPDLQTLLDPALYQRLHLAAFGLIGIVVGLVVAMVVIRLAGERVGNSLHDSLVGIAPRVAHHLRDKIRAFSVGLETIQGVSSALQLVGVSLLMWVLIAFAYISVLHAYPDPLGTMGIPMVIVLMGSSMVGSMLQLPAVGGGSQLATISMLTSGFRVEHEMAVSCGMLLWAVTFMSVVPTGLLLARHEHVSIRAVAEAEEKEAAALAE